MNYHIQCYICKREYHGSSFPWEEGTVDIEFRPWWGGEKIERDICPQCFKLRIIPSIEEHKKYFDMYKEVEVDPDGNLIKGKIEIKTTEVKPMHKKWWQIWPKSKQN